MSTMPTLVKVAEKSVSKGRVSVATNNTSTASLTDVNKLFNDLSFDSFEAEKDMSVLTSHSFVSHANVCRKSNKGSQSPGTDEITTDDPDVTMLGEDLDMTNLGAPCPGGSMVKDTYARIPNQTRELRSGCLDIDEDKENMSLHSEPTRKAAEKMKLMQTTRDYTKPAVSASETLVGVGHVLLRMDERSTQPGFPPNNHECKRVISQSQQLFKQRYERRVLHAIERFKDKRSEDFSNYQRLSEDQKLVEIRKVDSMLQRLEKRDSVSRDHLLMNGHEESIMGDSLADSREVSFLHLHGGRASDHPANSKYRARSSGIQATAIESRSVAPVEDKKKGRAFSQNQDMSTSTVRSMSMESMSSATEDMISSVHPRNCELLDESMSTERLHSSSIDDSSCPNTSMALLSTPTSCVSKERTIHVQRCPSDAHSQESPLAVDSSNVSRSVGFDEEIGARDEQISRESESMRYHVMSATPSRIVPVSHKRTALLSGRRGTSRFKKGIEMSPEPASDVGSVESIEEVRRDRMTSSSPSTFSSPLSTTRPGAKRCAAMSGKRGADTSRFKLTADSFSHDQIELELSVAGDSPISLNYKDSSSTRADILFSASQSPILQDVTEAFSPATERLRLDCLETPNKKVNDSIFTSVGFRTSANQRRVRWNLVAQECSHLQEVPANISLLEEAHFKINPLEVHKVNYTRKGREHTAASFPDPLEKYRGSEAKKIKEVFTWLKAKDQSSEAPSGPSKCGMVFSMKTHQIRDVVLKLVADSTGKQRQESSGGESTSNASTLVVCRSKVDTEAFASTLREGSSCSVLNHAALSLADRTRTTASTNCSTYDVVLTTFDAIMSKDVATTLNDDGHVIKRDSQNGWLSSRSSSSDEDDVIRVEKLSILHKLDWRRIVLVDDLGRKSYLAKAGTMRAKAAIALNAASRFVFFNHSGDKTNQWEALRRSDKNSFDTVAAVLRLADDTSIFLTAIDFKRAKKA